MLASIALPVLLASEAGAEAAKEGGVAVLGLNAGALLLQIATYVIVFLILKKYAFGPIVKTLDERRSKIETGLETADKMAVAKVELDQHKEAVLKEARVEAAKIVAESKKESADLIVAAEQKAQAKADQIVADAKAKMTDDITDAQKGLHKQLAGLVRNATEKVLRAKLDDKADAKLVEQATKELA